LFVQEVTSPETLQITGYITHLNVGTAMRGTALLATHGFLLTNIATTLSGCAIAADFSGVQLINVYAPSGTARWTERENIFNSELPELFYPTSYPIILGGDFNLLCTQPTPPVLSPQVEPFEKLSVASL
jgi:exonuclease III